MKFLEFLWNLLVKNRSVFPKITPLKQMASSETFCLKDENFQFSFELWYFEEFSVGLRAFGGFFRNFPSICGRIRSNFLDSRNFFLARISFRFEEFRAVRIPGQESSRDPVVCWPTLIFQLPAVFDLQNSNSKQSWLMIVHRYSSKRRLELKETIDGSQKSCVSSSLPYTPLLI